MKICESELNACCRRSSVAISGGAIESTPSKAGGKDMYSTSPKVNETDSEFVSFQTSMLSRASSMDDTQNSSPPALMAVTTSVGVMIRRLYTHRSECRLNRSPGWLRRNATRRPWPVREHRETDEHVIGERCGRIFDGRLHLTAVRRWHSSDNNGARATKFAVGTLRRPRLASRRAFAIPTSSRWFVIEGFGRAS